MNTRYQRWFQAWRTDWNGVTVNNDQSLFARQFGLHRQSIVACLNQRQKQHRGWYFEYYTPKTPPKEELWITDDFPK